MHRIGLVPPAVFLLALSALAQQPSSSPATPHTSTYVSIPVQAAKAENPVKATPDSIARARKWWTLDCEMCHGKAGDGKGETAKDMKLTILDFTDPAALKSRSDGELFYIIKNGYGDMPAEGPRIKTDENWDLVNYVRSLGKNREAQARDSSAKP